MYNIKFPQGYNGEIINRGGDGGQYIVPNDSILYLTNMYNSENNLIYISKNDALNINLIVANETYDNKKMISSPVILEEEIVYH